MRAEDCLRRLFETAVEAGRPDLASALPRLPAGRVLVLGAGKAAAAMAQGVEAAWPEATLSGFVVVPDGHEAPTRRIEVAAAAHPVPDDRSEAAALRALAEAERLGPEDLLLMLLSGGGSALLAAPAPGLSLADKRDATLRLLRSGAPIDVVNAVRRRLSRIKGGRLALAAAPASVVNLIVSDAPNDELSVVASGPTMPASAPSRAVMQDLVRSLPAKVRSVMDTAGDGPRAGDPRLPRIDSRLVARAADALAAAERLALGWGWRVHNVGDRIGGDAAEAGAEHAALALRLRDQVGSGGAPLVLLSGGETTVRVTGCGQGGRNTAFLLGLVLGLKGARGVYALAADTDGLDGVGGHAGAVAGPDTLARLAAIGLDPQACLAADDSRRPFEALGDLIVTGPTRTNVNDVRAILVQPPAEGQ